jgi:hypothetical protein
MIIICSRYRISVQQDFEGIFYTVRRFVCGHVLFAPFFPDNSFAHIFNEHEFTL